MELNEIIRILLNMRGISLEEDIEEYLSDKPKLTHAIELMPDLMAGASLILDEIKAGGKIAIYGDYDADGITSTTLMLDVLSNLMDSEHLMYYIPSRFEEGYGLNKSAIDLIFKKGATLIVTVDCGSVSTDEVEYAKSLGLKIIVTDHHNITDKQANCILINPKRPDSNYPFKELSGCGVAFKLAQAIQKLADLPKSVLTDVLDLVAIGTIGDVMPLVDENRTLVKFGLKVINQSKRPGLIGLMEGASLKLGTVSSDNVSFVIVPNLNASGRIEDASLAVSLLSAKEKTEKLDETVLELLKKNAERKKLQNETYEKALEVVKEKVEDFITIYLENAHEGIIGIVAGKIKEEFNRPTILVTPTGDTGLLLKGTGRSIDGVDIYSLLLKHQELFEKFGGHKGACGFTMKNENLDKLKSLLNEDIKELLDDNPNLFERKVAWDLDLDFSDISLELAEGIKLMQPFGTKNPKPVFKLNSCALSDIRYMGNDNQHVRFIAKPEFDFMDGLRPVSCVLFNKAQNIKDKLLEGSICDIIGSLDYQVWQGQKKVQFQVNTIDFID